MSVFSKPGRLPLLLAGLLFIESPAPAQIDPEKRQLFQLGYNQPLQGKGPLSGYAFYYRNEPGFLHTNLTLRLAIAPVYLDSELGIANALSPRTDLGIGLAGGGFADSYSEVRRGKYWKEESFTGHGADASVSLYHRFNPGSVIPLNAVLRGSVHHSVFERDSDTADAFLIPDDLTSFKVRAGLRLGGREPLMLPALGLELSAWYEGQFRNDPNAYGFNGDRSIEADSHLFWARALFIYTLPEMRHNLAFNLTAGTSLSPDRFSAYRIGGVLPLASEFPLNLPGYYFQELSADQFVLFGLQYTLPLDAANRWNLIAVANTATIDYLPGTEQSGHWHTGVGGGLAYRSTEHAWQIILSYSYGIDAIRRHGRGAHSIGFLLQYDLEADLRGERPFFENWEWIKPGNWRGFDQLLGR